jgi:acetylornithine deacetylase/succinyl-diaminopimelate desuccinylase-like protein
MTTYRARSVFVVNPPTETQQRLVSRRVVVSLAWILLISIAQRIAQSAVALDDSPPASKLTLAVRDYRISHEKQILQEFASLLAIPNHASDAEHIGENARAIVRLLQARHIRTSLLEAEGAPPVVLGELPSSLAKTTVTFYAHYDGQPVDAKAWSTDPFTPTLVTDSLQRGGRVIDFAAVTGASTSDWRLYARSASDDKAAIIGLLSALDALQAAGVTPTVNLKFVFEGEEEMGSPHLASVLERNKKELKTDLWILCDGPIDQTGKMQIFFGARGVTSLDITVYGPNRGLHSGHYGNWAPNPIVLLTHLLDSMRDSEAQVLIPGFYEDVRPLSARENLAMAAVDDRDLNLKRALGIRRTEGQPASLMEQLAKPALNVHGISAGHVGAEAANVIESEARASIDFRLVPSQTPERVRRLVESHITQQGFWVRHEPPDEQQRIEHDRIAMLEWSGGAYPGARTSIDLPVSLAVVALIEEAIGEHVLRVPMLGGSIPMYLFQGRNSVPVIGIPIANFDNNQHSSNENIRLGNLWAGIEIYAALLANLGGVPNQSFSQLRLPR